MDLGSTKLADPDEEGQGTSQAVAERAFDATVQIAGQDLAVKAEVREVLALA